MSDDMVRLSKPQVDIVQRLVGHWTERYQTTPEELARTFFDPETGRRIDPARLREVVDGASDVLSHDDIRIFTEVVCEELKGIEEEEVSYHKRKMTEPPRTVKDVVAELNREYAKG